MDHHALLKRIEASNDPRIKVAITDLDGILRGKYINKQKFQSALQGGFGFCNVVFGWDMTDSCYDNASYTGWHSGYPDVTAQIDLSTFRTVPWDNHVPFFLGEFVNEAGAPLEICPRQLLKRVIAKAESMGLHPVFACEYEFFNFKETAQSFAAKGYRDPEPITPGMFGYSLLRAGQNRDYLKALFEELTAFDIPVEGLHTETGPGVLEAAIVYTDALAAADRAVLFKTATKEIAARFGIMPTFMAKWNSSLPGSGGHMHQSMWDAEGKNNVFYDKKNPHGMSALFKHYLAGQLQLMPDMLALYAPTINSYKRLVEGMWAPTRPAWSVDNRTASLRVIPGSSKATRLETRVAGADANPYLAMAAALASGLYGIENKLPLTQSPVQGSAYGASDTSLLPRDLAQATAVLSGSKIASEILGETFVKHFVQTREWEWREYRKAVTDWELKRYFEII